VQEVQLAESVKVRVHSERRGRIEAAYEVLVLAVVMAIEIRWAQNEKDDRTQNDRKSILIRKFKN
jgi:hypothetical protein